MMFEMMFEMIDSIERVVSWCSVAKRRFDQPLAIPARTSICQGVSLSNGVFGLETSSATS